jgi:N-acetyltransferase
MNIKNKLENENFIIKQLRNNDFNLLYNIGKNKKIWEQHPENDRWKKEKFYVFFQNGIKNQFGIYGIFDKSNNNIIGSSRFYSYNKKENSVKIGFTFLSPKHWGVNTNLQIKTLMLGYAFNYVENVYFDIGKNNIRSRKAIEKIGATLYLDAEVGNVSYILRFEDLQIINSEVIDEIKKNRSMETSC